MKLNMFDNIEGLVIRERDDPFETQENKSVFGGTTARLPEKTVLAMAYVPFQQWGEVYSGDEALKKGTLFPALDLPFEKGAAR